MGMFSFVCSDTDRALVCYDVDMNNKKNKELCTKTAYCLIPKEFGGGAFYVENNYDGYGCFYDKGGKEVDVYDELAFWNLGVRDRLKGIELYYQNGLSDQEIVNNPIKYNLKIVENYKPYESAFPCWDDNNQGWGYQEEEDND